MSGIQITREHIRILQAVFEGRMTWNAAGRYVIDGEPRPDRRAREELVGGAYITTTYYQNRGTVIELGQRGRALLEDNP